MRSSSTRRILRTIAVCLGLLLFLAGRQTSSAQQTVDAGQQPLQFTIAGSRECFVDQPVTFEVKVRNTGVQPLAAQSLDVRVNIHRVTRTSVQSEETFIVNGTATKRTLVKTVTSMSEFSLLPGSAVTCAERLVVKALAPDESQTLTLKLTFKQQGNMTVVVGPPAAPRLLLRSPAPIPPEAPVAYWAAVASWPVNVTFDPQTPLKDLLPAQPQGDSAKGLPETLQQVPELSLQQPSTKFAAPDESLLQAVRTVARINLLNRKKADGFMEALLAQRADLAGLPFAMGDACRLKEERGRQFGSALASLRQAAAPLVLAPGLPTTQSAVPTVVAPVGDRLMDEFRKQCAACESNDHRLEPRATDDVVPARVAALMQVMMPEPTVQQQGLVKYLASTFHVDATRALAKLALFSEEAEVRLAAVEALKTRREKDYTDLLVMGLSYPWPAVAKRSSEAILRLGRTDLIERLLDALDRPDPRAPQTQDRNGKKATVVRELVRINHHRNCLLCHAPSDPSENLSAEKADILRPLLVQLPLPDQELPKSAPSGGHYDSSNPDILVRIDVSYLRQDFSVKLPVADAAPWPEMQRFDFVVRTREVSTQEAAAYEKLLRLTQPGVLSPYHRAALFALREMTGLDAAPTADAWRKLLADK